MVGSPAAAKPAGTKEGSLAALAGTSGIISAAQTAPASIQFFTFKLSNRFKLLRAFEWHNAARPALFKRARLGTESDVSERDTAPACQIVGAGADAGRRPGLCTDVD